MSPWNPCSAYNFKADIGVGKRPFLFSWLKQYDWLCYSAILKGAFCKFCVLFEPPVDKGGVQGAFIKTAFIKYKHFQAQSKIHSKCSWHIFSVQSAKEFIAIMDGKKIDVHQMLNCSIKNVIESNNRKLHSIISSIIFLGVHGIPLRGKTDDTAIFNNLLHFRVECGDAILNDHFKNSAKNASYMSHRIQNELISTIGSVICNMILKRVNEAECYSLLADETMDIAGIEQLSICLKYVTYENNQAVIKEDFVGFISLEKLDSESISNKIISNLQEWGLDLNKLVGQGYDGASTMAGHVSGVQKKIRDKYKKAVFVHCASHRLNLVLNELNSVPCIRNTIGIVKETINFFKESSLRRIVAPSLTKLCVTRWSESHKAIRKYYENFLLIVEALEYLKLNGNKDTSLKATCHLNSVTTSQFIVCLRIIAKYSATIEPITNSLQGVNCDLFSANKHIKDLIKYISDDRANNEEMFLTLMKDINMYLNELGITLMTPRVSSKQTLRNNPPSSGPEDYYRKSIYIPYLDSLIISLNERFPEDNSKYEIISVHPKYLKQIKKEEFIIQLKNLKLFYGEFIENIEEEGLVWYNMWKEKNETNMDFLKLLDEVTFLPSIKKCILIAATLPSTTCSVERSFRFVLQFIIYCFIFTTSIINYVLYLL